MAGRVFGKIMVEILETGELVDITDLPKPQYERFLELMRDLKLAYELVKRKDGKVDENCPRCGVDDRARNGYQENFWICRHCGKNFKIERSE